MIGKLQKAMDDGEIRQGNPVQLLISMIGMCLFAFIGREILEEMFDGLNILDPDFIEQRKKAVFDLLWNGVKST